MALNFIGQGSYSIDNKGRIIVPAKFRARLGPRAIVTRGIENCLQIFPEERWETLTMALNERPFGAEKVRIFRRKFLASASECELDRQGRIMIPETLRKYAHLDGEGIIIGVGDYLEIWAPDTWKQFDESTEEEFLAIAEQLSEEGI